MTSKPARAMISRADGCGARPSNDLERNMGKNKAGAMFSNAADRFGNFLPANSCANLICNLSANETDAIPIRYLPLSRIGALGIKDLGASLIGEQTNIWRKPA